MQVVGVTQATVCTFAVAVQGTQTFWQKNRCFRWESQYAVWGKFDVGTVILVAETGILRT